MHDYDFYYDFTDIFKNGTEARVQILHWYTVDGQPKAVVLVLSNEGFPREGEILRVGLGREFFAASK